MKLVWFLFRTDTYGLTASADSFPPLWSMYGLLRGKLEYFLLLGVFLLVPVSLVAQSLQVVSVSPSPNDNMTLPGTPVRIEFNMPIDTSGISQQFVITGVQRPLYDFGWEIDPSQRIVILYPSPDFLIGEHVEISIRFSLTGSGGETFTGYNWRFTIKPTLATPPYFAPPIAYPLYTGPAIIAGDINDDGAVDLVVNNPVTCYVLVNDGSGYFSLHQTLPGAFTHKIWLVDGDLDGNKELVLTPFVYEQAGDGLFYYDSTLAPVDRDMNRDGFADYTFVGAIQENFHYLGIRYNDGTGALGSEIDTVLVDSNIVDLAIDDFNNDGIMDVAYTTMIFAVPGGVGGRNSVVVAYRDSQGDTLYRNIYSNANFPVYLGMPFLIRSAELNNDGFIDILVLTNTEDHVIFNDTQGGFDIGNAQSVGGGDLYHWAVVGDISGDGWLDLIYNFEIGLGEHGETIYQRNDHGSFFLGIVQERDSVGVFTSAVGDFDGNGALDVATAWNDGMYVYFNQEIQGQRPFGSLPQGFMLYQNYPNPFNGRTTVSFSLPESGQVESAIYDISGKEVRKFSKRIFPAGENQLYWDGKTNTGKEMSSGIYIWKFEFEGLQKSVKLILIR